MVVEVAAFVKEVGFRAVEVFGPGVRVHCPPAKADGAAAAIADGKDDAPAEPVVEGAVVGLGDEARVQHQGGGDPFLLQRLQQGLALVGGKADFPAVLRVGRQAATVQIRARLGCCGGFQLQAEPFHRLFHHADQVTAVIGLFRRTGVLRGHLQPGLGGQNLHRLHEAEVFGFLDEGQRVAFGVAAEAVVIALAIIDVERGGFFLMERAGCPHVTLG